MRESSKSPSAAGRARRSRSSRARSVTIGNPLRCLPGTVLDTTSWAHQQRLVGFEAEVGHVRVELASLEAAAGDDVPEVAGNIAFEFVAALWREGYPAFRQPEQDRGTFPDPDIPEPDDVVVAAALKTEPWWPLNWRSPLPLALSQSWTV